MLDIKTFVVNQLQENCYIVSDDTKEAVIIDCGAFYDSERDAVVNYIRDNGLTLRHQLCTHGHFDHVYGADTILDTFSLRPEVHSDDRELVEDIDFQYREMLGISYHRPSVSVGRLLADGDSIEFGNHSLTVIHTPGHSPGSVVFYCKEEHLAFTGDTLFRMSVGRTDLRGGSWPKLMASLIKIATIMPSDTKLYPGHGPISIMDDEMKYNPYLSPSGA